jgi:uncharacterized protein with NRDE domain
MCLLVVVSRLDPGAPLVVGANRDERLDRPATAMTVLAASGPRILGGRDEVAGGTWLAVNEHGVVAGLTNRPSPDGPDPSKRSRGELPPALAAYRDAASAVEDFVARRRCEEYNPAWILVGDRTSLYALDMTGTGSPGVEALGPGVHILENNPLHAPSPKADHVRALLGETRGHSGADLLGRLRAVLIDHTVPIVERGAGAGADGDAEEAAGTGGGSGGGGSAGGRPPETLAACDHTERYGTRSSTLVAVPADTGRPPTVSVADGHPCTSPFADATGLWGS